ncbi:MAG: PilZ domain-containing protein [Planctomycetota bacterium]
MTSLFDSERRGYIRIKNELTVRYKFISSTISDSRLNEIYTGTTTNISGGGIMISGVIPNSFWIPELLMQRIVIGLNFLLPQESEPIKTLTRVAWVETIDENTHLCLLGLKFKEITSQDTDKIFKFIIHNQLPS